MYPHSDDSLVSQDSLGQFPSARDDEGWWESGIARSRKREPEESRFGGRVYLRGDIGAGYRVNAIDEEPPVLKSL